MPEPVKSVTVLETILEWSEDRPSWQRDALRRIVTDGMPDDEGMGELLALCKKEHGDGEVEIEPIPLGTEHLPVDPGEGESISLAAIENVVGVNQLAIGQSLTFETGGLTIIYGPNGTGKSGYSRILKKACRARHAGDIMPDVYNPSASGNATAALSVVRSDGTQTQIDWEDDGESEALLSAITVFDKECASVHIQKKNEVWFRPFGLDIPDDLAGVCQAIKKILTEEKENLQKQRNQVFEEPIWSDLSSIGKVLSEINFDTDLAPITPSEPFSETSESRLIQLQRDLSQDSTKVASEQVQVATRLEQMLTYLKQIETACSDQALTEIFTLKHTAMAAREVADTAASEAFADLELKGVGEPTWKALWESARLYTKVARSEDATFPPEQGDTCVLCLQEIDENTAKRLLGFEEFIKQDTEEVAVDAEAALASALSSLSDLNIHVLKVSLAYQHIKINNAELSRSILGFLAIARLRQRQTLSQIKNGQFQELTASVLLPEAEIEEMVDTIKAYAKSLSAEPEEEDRKALLIELAELQDSKQAYNLITIATVEKARLVEEKLIEDCLPETTTTAITRLGNTIADDLVTPRMRDQFQQEIVDLAGSRARVEIVRSGGRFGSPQYEVQLFANPETRVHDVLSEGEQTCVALASYLTELANAAHKSALIFDDPVTSLDHKWRSKVAKRLVMESRIRQVVIFTHDLIFVNDMLQMALDNSIPLGLSHLTRGVEGVGIVNDDLPWRASGVRERIDKLEKAAREAQKLFDAEDDEAYRSAAHSIYDKMRAAWERGLEDIFFAGVILRHRDYINTKGLGRVIAIEESDVDIFRGGFKKCCDFVEAHDASRGRDADPPEPKEIFEDIATLQIWASELTKKMNAV